MSTNFSHEETLLENQNSSNDHLRTQPENESALNVRMRNQSWTDDEVPLNAYDPQDHQRVNDDNKNANPEDNQPALLNEEQEYWHKSTMV